MLTQSRDMNDLTGLVIKNPLRRVFITIFVKLVISKDPGVFTKQEKEINFLKMLALFQLVNKMQQLFQ